MNFKKLINYINRLFQKKTINKRRNKYDLKSKIKKGKSIILNKVNKVNFIKKRKQITIKSFNFNFCGYKSYYHIVLIIAILAILYILLGPHFKVKIINIVKQEDITNVTIAYNAIDKYRGKSIFNINENEILKSLKNYQHNIRDIKTDISLPNELNITINSYKGVFNTNINNKQFVITENGTLIPSIYSNELSELIIKDNFDKNKFLDYKKTFNSEYINKISKIIEFLKENIIGLKINDIKYYVIEREAHIITDKNTIIIFDLNGKIKEQIEKISILNKDHINISKNDIIYIDLRIINKIFYCTKYIGKEKRINDYKCNRNIKSIYSD